MARKDERRLNGKGSVPQKNKAMPGGINRKERQRLKSSRFGKQERKEARRRGQEMHRQQMEIARARKQKWIDHQREKNAPDTPTPKRGAESFALQRADTSLSRSTEQRNPFEQVPFDREREDTRTPRTRSTRAFSPQPLSERRTVRETPEPVVPTEEKPKKKYAFTSAQRMRRMYERFNPLASRKNQKDTRKELGKNIRLVKNEERTETIGAKFNHLGTYQLLASAPARRSWDELNPKQQATYEKQVMGIIDQYLTSRKVMEFTPFETITGNADFRTQSRLVDEYAARNPKSKIVNETENSRAAFARTLTKKEKQARLEGQRDVFLEGSIQDAQRNMDQLIAEIQRQDKRKDGAKRATVLRERLGPLNNRISILSGIRSNIRAREAGRKEWLISRLFPRPTGPQPRPVRKERDEHLEALRATHLQPHPPSPPPAPAATEPSPFAHLRRKPTGPQVIRLDAPKPAPARHTRETSPEEVRLHRAEMDRRYEIADQVRKIKKRTPLREKFWPRDEIDIRRQAERELKGLPPEPTRIKRWMQAGKEAFKRIRFRRRRQGN